MDPEDNDLNININVDDKDATKNVDVNKERKAAAADALTAERNRVADLLETGKQFGQPELAQKAIENGESVDQLNRSILAAGDFKATKAEKPSLGLSEKQIQKFSIVRAINALANPNDSQAQRDASYEFEISNMACEKLRRDSKGIFIPHEVLARDMNAGTAAEGGNLIETELMSGSFIESLENAMRLQSAGATILNGLTGNCAIPRQTGGSSHFWLAENGAPTEASATFDQVALSPKTVGAFTDISRKMLLQSSISVEAFVRNDLALRLALAIDQAGINGTGTSNQPKGILNVSGIGSVAGGTNGLAPTWSHIVKLESEVANANADADQMCYLTNTKVRGKLKETEKFSGGGREIWTGDNQPLNGYRAEVSNQVPSGLTKGTSDVCSAVIFGNFADLLIGFWGGLDLQVDPYTQATKGAVRVTAFQDVDIAVRHPESFAAMVDALT